MFAGRTGYPAGGTFTEYPPLDDRTVFRMIELLSILGTLFLLDIVTTQVILRMGGAELNPFMAGVVAYPALHLGIKAAILLLIFSVSLIAEKRVEGSGFIFYGFLILLYGVVVLHNLLFFVPRMIL
jgi:hypothetical protein